MQLLTPTPAARPAGSDVALFKPGQVLDAVVVGKTPEGLTTLKIGDVVVNAQLPQTLPPGTTLQLQVKAATGPVPQLSIVGAPMVPGEAAAPAPVLPLSLPTQVPPQISAAPLMTQAAAANTPAQTFASVPAAIAPATPPSLPNASASPAASVVAAAAVAAPPGSDTLGLATRRASTAPLPQVAASPAAVQASQPPQQPQSVVPTAVGQPGPIVESVQLVTQANERVVATPSIPAAQGGASSTLAAQAAAPVAQATSNAAQAAPTAVQNAVPQAVADPDASPSIVVLAALRPASLTQPTPSVAPATPTVTLPPPGSTPPAQSPAPVVASPPVAPVPPVIAPPNAAPTAVAVLPGQPPSQSQVSAQVQTSASVAAQPAAAAPAIAVAEPTHAPPSALPGGAFAPSPSTAPSALLPALAAQVLSQPAAPLATASTAPVVPTAEPEAVSPLLVAQGSPRPQATMADMPKSAVQAPAVVAQPGAPPLPSTPQAALAQMLPEAIAKQNSLAPLLTSLATLVGRQGVLPEPVLRAALQVLAQRIALPAGGPTAEILKAAIAKSGIYLEAGLSGDAAPTGDLKAGLAALKGALAASLGGNPAPIAPGKQAAPPIKGMPPRADAIDLPPLPDSPREAARAVHSQADAALSRVKLMQLASLPDAGPARGPVAEQRMELPFLIGQELVMAQFQVMRDGARQKNEAKRGWTMRFAMNFSATGEVGAEVGILGKSVNVSLWAAEPDTAERLNAALPDLAQALAALGLDPGGVRVRNTPPEAQRPSAGHLLDSLT